MKSNDARTAVLLAARILLEKHCLEYVEAITNLPRRHLPPLLIVCVSELEVQGSHFCPYLTLQHESKLRLFKAVAMPPFLLETLKLLKAKLHHSQTKHNHSQYNTAIP
eukprot:2841386-Amphidinium_carterae.1